MKPQVWEALPRKVKSRARIIRIGKGDGGISAADGWPCLFFPPRE